MMTNSFRPTVLAVWLFTVGVFQPTIFAQAETPPARPHTPVAIAQGLGLTPYKERESWLHLIGQADGVHSLHVSATWAVGYVEGRTRDENFFFFNNEKVPGSGQEFPIPVNFSADRKRFFAVLDGKRCIVDGKVGPTFDEIVWNHESGLGPGFFPAGKSFYYVGKLSGKDYLVRNHEIISSGHENITWLDFDDAGVPRFFVKGAGKMWIVERGVAGPKFDEAGPLWGTKSSHGYAYLAKEGQDQIVIRDGKSGPRFTRIEEPLYSPDGKRLAYIGIRADGNGSETQRIVVDDVEQTEYDQVNHPIFSPDSKHLLYVARNDGVEFVVYDGVPDEPLEEIRFGFEGFFCRVPRVPFAFTQDGRQRTYHGKRNGKPGRVVDGKFTPSEEENQYSNIVTSPDGKLSAESITTYEDQPNGESKPKHLLRFGKLKIPNARAPVFEASGRLFYVESLDKGERLVIRKDDAIENGPLYDHIDYAHLCPDSKRYAYIAKQNGKELVVLDGVPGPPVGDVHDLQFSSDGRRMAFVAMNGEDDYRLYVDNRPGPKFPTYDFKSNGLFPYTRAQVTAIRDESFESCSPSEYSNPGDFECCLVAARDEDNRFYYIINGVPGMPCDKLSDYVAEPDGSIKYLGAVNGAVRLFRHSPVK